MEKPTIDGAAVLFTLYQARDIQFGGLFGQTKRLSDTETLGNLIRS